MAIVPPARGGRALPVKPKPMKPPTPRVIRPKAPDPNAVASQNAMSAFRTALAQLQSSTPAVDSAAIYAPYRASQQVTGQLGQGLQQSELASGQAAQQQYGQALGQAQQQAAQFGISAGAGANPTALQNTGAAPLAQQTNAYAAAAPQAAAQWQQLLERSAAAKVAGATTDRNNLIAQGSANLSTALPAAIRDEKQSLFQGRVQKFNEGLARTQLSAKQNADLRNYGLDVAKVQQSGQVAATRASQTAASNAERQRHNLATESTAKASLALRQRGKAASDKGLKGISSAVKALSGTTSGGSTKKVAKGWDVQVVALDPDTGDPSGDAKTMTLPDKRFAPKGFQIVKVKGAPVAQPHYAILPNTPKTSGATASVWDQQMRALIAANPPGSTAAIKAFLGPRPKK